MNKLSLLLFGLYLNEVYSFTCSDFVVRTDIESHLLLRFLCILYKEGACELSENNIVAHDRFTNTPQECQIKCKNNPDCSWFTHLDTQCYLLKDCGHQEQ